MNLLRKITLAMVASVLLFATSCVKNEVSDEVKELRKEQLNLAKALTELKNQEAVEKKFQAQLAEYNATAKQLLNAKNEAEYKTDIAKAESAAEEAKLNIEKMKLEVQAAIEKAKRELISNKSVELGKLYTAYENAVKTYNGAVSQIAQKNKDVVNAQLTYDKQAITVKALENKIISEKTAAEYAVKIEEAKLISLEKKAAAATKYREELENSETYQGLEAKLAALQKSKVAAEMTQKDKKVALEEANSALATAKANLTPVEEIVDLMDKEDAPKGYTVQLKEREDIKTKATAANADLDVQITPLQAKLDAYITEFATVKANYDKKKAEKDAEDVTLRKLKLALDNALDVVGAQSGDIPVRIADLNLGYKIAITDDDTANVGNEPKATLLLVPNPEGSNDQEKYSFWYNARTGAATEPPTEQRGWVSKKIATELNANADLKALNAAYKAYAKQKEKVDAIQKEIAKLVTDYDFYLRETAYKISGGNYDGEGNHIEGQPFDGNVATISASPYIQPSTSVALKIMDLNSQKEANEKKIKAADEKIAELNTKIAALKPEYDKVVGTLADLKTAVAEKEVLQNVAAKEEAKAAGIVAGIEAAIGKLTTEGSGKIDINKLLEKAKKAEETALQAVEDQKVEVAEKQQELDEKAYKTDGLNSAKQNLARLNKDLADKKAALTKAEEYVKYAKQKMEDALKDLEAAKAA